LMEKVAYMDLVGAASYASAEPAYLM